MTSILHDPEQPQSQSLFKLPPAARARAIGSISDQGHTAAPQQVEKKPSKPQPVAPNLRARVARRPKFSSRSKDDDSGDGDDDPAPSKPHRLLSKKQVLDRVPLSFGSIWKMMRAGTFPQSRSISENKTVWLESEIDAWILSAPLRPVLAKED